MPSAFKCKKNLIIFISFVINLWQIYFKIVQRLLEKKPPRKEHKKEVSFLSSAEVI